MFNKLYLPLKMEASTAMMLKVGLVLLLYLPLKVEASTATSQQKRTEIQLYLPLKVEASTAEKIKDICISMLYLPLKVEASTADNPYEAIKVSCTYLSKWRLQQQQYLAPIIVGGCTYLSK